jgi:hypothetical protein
LSRSGDSAAESSDKFPTIPVVIAAALVLLIAVVVVVCIVLRCRTVYETEYDAAEEIPDVPESIAFTDERESSMPIYYENPANDSDFETITMLVSDCDIGDASEMVVT